MSLLFSLRSAPAQDPDAASTRGARNVRASQPPSGKTYALLIGISTYKYVRSLEFADKDAELFADFLKSPAGGSVPPDNIRVLTNEKATRAGIDDAITNFVEANGGKENSLVLFVAGHGVYLKTEEDPVTKKEIEREPYILTFDSNPQDAKTTGYPMDEFRANLAAQAHRFAQVLVFADVCHAGNIAGIAGASDLQEAVRQVFQGAAGDLGLMVASHSSKYAFESPLFGGGHGVFSYFVIDGMNGSAALPDTTVIHWNELAHYVSNEVFNYTGGKQSPRDFPTREDMVVIDDTTRKPGVTLLPAQKLSREEEQRDSRNRQVFMKPVTQPATLAARGEIGTSPDRFESAIAGGSLLPEDANGAYQLLDQPPQTPDQRTGRERRLRVALEDQGQEIISRYLDGDQIPQRKEDFTRCARDFEVASLLMPDVKFDDSRRLFCQGRALIFDAKYAEADGLLQQSIQLDPKRAYAWNALGISRLEQINRSLPGDQANGIFDLAREAFQNARRYAPYWAYPLHNLALTLTERGGFDEAIRMYKVAMSIAPQYSYLPYNLGLLYARMGDNDNAYLWYRAALTAATQYRPGQRGAWGERAQILNALGALAGERGPSPKARKYFEDALVDDPRNVSARHNLALILATGGDYAAADRLWLANISDAPGFLASRIAYADSLQRRGKTKDAIREYEEIMREAPAYDGARESLARLYAGSGELDRALDELDRAIRQTPSNPALVELRGDIFLKMMRKDLAIRDWTEARRIAGDGSMTDRINRKLKSVR